MNDPHVSSETVKAEQAAIVDGQATPFVEAPDLADEVSAKAFDVRTFETNPEWGFFLRRPAKIDAEPPSLPEYEDEDKILTLVQKISSTEVFTFDVILPPDGLEDPESFDVIEMMKKLMQERSIAQQNGTRYLPKSITI